MQQTFQYPVGKGETLLHIIYVHLLTLESIFARNNLHSCITLT